jgi:hypothetical protein
MANFFPLIINPVGNIIQELPANDLLDLSQSGIANSGNITVSGVVSATGNITGEYFIGNGSLLTGIDATSIQNGNSNVRVVASNGNVTVGINGTSNVAVFASTGLKITGSIEATSGFIGTLNGSGANVTNLNASNISSGTLNQARLANAAVTLGSTALTLGATVTSVSGLSSVTSTTFVGALTGAATTAGTVTTAAQPNITSVGTLSSVSITGNTTSGNLLTGGLISATGGITGASFTGNGRALTSLSASNIDTGTLPSARLSGTYTITVSGSATTAGTVTTAAQPNITSVGTLSSLGVTGNTTSGNLLTGGLISATGGITGSQFNGSGAGLTSIPGANVTGTVANATYATSAGSATTATSATTAGTVTTAAQPNITSVGTLSSVSVSGNTTSGNLVTAGLVNAGTLQTSGNAVIGGNLIVNGNTINVNISDLNVQDPIIGLGRDANNSPLTTNDGKDRGTQLWYYDTAERSGFIGYDNNTGKLIAAANVSLTDEIVTVNNYGSFVVGSAEATTVSASGNVTGGNIITGGLISATGGITGASFTGNGRALTSLNAANINTGTLPSARLSGTYTITVSGAATTAGTVTTAAQPNITSVGTLTALAVTGNVTSNGIFIGSGAGLTSIPGANVTGTVANATYATSAGSATTAGTVTTAAQPNITSVGTLTALAVTGNTTSGNFIGTLNGSGANVTSINATNISSGTLAQARLANSSLTVNGTAIALGGSATITAANPSALTIGTGLSGTSYNGSTGVTITNTGVTSIVAGTNIAVSGATGAVTVSVTGTVPTATTAGTVTTAAQPNITSVGTLTALAVTGNTTSGNFIGTLNGSGANVSSLNASNLASGTVPSARLTGSYSISVTSATTAGTVTTAAQPNITSVGTMAAATITTLTTAGITKSGTNAVGNIGQTDNRFNNVFARASSASYADLAEIYLTDSDYPAGTVVVFGGAKEVTESTEYADTRLAGVISTNPAFVMNDSAEGQPIALQGRVPCSVVGNIQPGDLITTSNIAGVGTRLDPADWRPGTVLGKALTSYNSDEPGTIEVVVGRV